jgi:hypothetical protein
MVAGSGVILPWRPRARSHRRAIGVLDLGAHPLLIAPPETYSRCMDELLLNVVRRGWWLAVVACIGCAVECSIERNTFLGALTGPLLVCMWAAAIILLDRWVLRDINRQTAGFWWPPHADDYDKRQQDAPSRWTCDGDLFTAERVRKLEALAARPGTPGEGAAARAAIERIRTRFRPPRVA